MAAAAPKEGGDEEAIIYSIDMGEGKKRDFTPQQIKGLLERYQDLNYRQMQTKPILDAIQRQMKDYGATPEELVELISNVKKAKDTKDTSAGNKKNTAPMDDGDGDDLESALAKWEEDNVSSLPPGYKDMHKSMKGINSQISQLTQMLQKVLGATGGVTNAAKASLEKANTEKSSAIRQQISNNLNAAQQHFKLPDEAAKEFMAFAMDRGYTLEDFVDPRMTATVMQDFANSRNSPEMERVRRIMQRREAMTGSLQPGAGGDASPPQKSAMENDIEAMISRRR